MVDEQTVRLIVETYNLPEKTEERVVRIALAGLDYRNVERFDQQYDHIADLVDRYAGHFRERLPRVWISRGGSKRRVYKLSCLLAREEPEEQTEREVQDGHERTEAALRVLKRRLPPRQYGFVLHLVAWTDGRYALDLGRVAGDIGTVKRRLAQLEERYAFNGRIAMPARPIKKVKFNPLHIAFGQRSYDGDPLRFFLEHRDAYEDMSRTQLSKHDPGLYVALRTAGQLDEAIPLSGLSR